MVIHELFAYLCVDDTAKAIDWYGDVFGATEKFRLTEPSGRIGHAELAFGGTTLMLSDEFPEYGIRGAATIGATSVTIHLHVDDADALVERAVNAGAALEIAVQDQFYGERSGSFKDPFGHRWNVGHSIEELSPEEMQRRYTELMKSESAQ
ncbi:VOC family protein [Variovorax sp. KK3]|uniref:VOC family protein n=1 Tax=Variovorax sp. KK3 TaxID=1855728 RepID=UPI00097BD4F7|nr:VOC family protein [Variovorax sp. KK3]